MTELKKLKNKHKKTKKRKTIENIEEFFREATKGPVSTEFYLKMRSKADFEIIKLKENL